MKTNQLPYKPVFSYRRKFNGHFIQRYSGHYSKTAAWGLPTHLFYGVDPEHPDAIPVYEFQNVSDSSYAYSTSSTYEYNWKQGAIAFYARKTESNGAIGLGSFKIFKDGVSIHFNAPVSISDKLNGAEIVEGSGTFFITAVDKSKWMEQSTGIHNNKLRNICLPSAHDAGTAKLQDIKTDDNGEDIAGFMNALKKIGNDIADTGIGIIIDVPLWVSDNLFGVVKGLGRAQGHSIQDQLNGGIRGLDLRIYYYDVTNEFYTYHGALGEKLDTVLSQINSFLSSTAGEILYVTFTHQKHIDATRQNQITSKLKTMLGSFAYLRNTTNALTLFDQTYNDIVTQGTAGSKIIIVYGQSSDAEFWPNSYSGQGSSLIDGFYSNSSTIDDMLSKQIKHYTEAVADNKPFSLFMTLTPQESDVYERVAGALAGPLAAVAPLLLAIPFVGWSIFALVEALAAGLAIYNAALTWRTLEELTEKLTPTLVDKVNDNFVPGSGPNLISLLWIDFYHKSEIVDLAITVSNKS